MIFAVPVAATDLGQHIPAKRDATNEKERITGPRESAGTVNIPRQSQTRGSQADGIEATGFEKASRPKDRSG